MSNSNGLWDQIKGWSQTAERVLNMVATPLKPFLGDIGRFLLVVTFLEDALRIFMQWSEQIGFMTNYRSCPRFLAHLFLFYTSVTMIVGSGMALVRFRMPVACALLASVLVIQTLGYGLLFQPSFMLRNFSLIGGLLLLLADWINCGGTLFSVRLPSSSSGASRRIPPGSGLLLIPGLPAIISDSERSTYVSLFGRILLVLLFCALGLHGKFTPLKIVMTILCAISCLMVAVGFKAKHSAMFLVAILSVSNILINPWWTHSKDSAERDFLRYDFFQMLSIMGGFLLLANSGPGELSVDAGKKKDF